MTDKPDTDPLLPRIETVLALYEISATAFGYRAVGDPALVGRMRGGATLRARRRARVEAFLKRVEENEGMPE